LVTGIGGSLINFVNGNNFNKASGFTWEPLRWIVCGQNAALVVLGINNIYTSPSGSSWTQNWLSSRESINLGSSSKPIYSTAINQFAALTQGLPPAMPAGVLTSADGVHWQAFQMTATGLTATANAVLVTTNSGIYSYNGQGWAEIGSQTNLQNPVYAAQLVIATTSSGIMVSSDGGKTWKASKYQGTCLSAQSTPVVSDGKVVVFAGNGCFVSSPVGSVLGNWTTGSLPVSAVDVIVTPGGFLVVDKEGNLVRSANGKTWQSAGNIGATSVSGLASVGNTVYAVGDKGSIFKATTGV